MLQRIITPLVIAAVIIDGLLWFAAWRTTAPAVSTGAPPTLGLVLWPLTINPAAVTAAASETAWTMTAVGDVMLDRHVRQTIVKRGAAFPFADIAPLLTGDAVLANLEGPFTDNPSVATDTNLVFTFDPAVTPVLKHSGFTILSVANNHTLNFGQAGLDKTRRVLDDSDLAYFGDPKNRVGFVRTASVHGRSVAWVGYNGLAAGLDSVLEEIRSVRATADTVIVAAHWGNEYNRTFTARQQQTAHQFISAGADLVLGSHPHVVEPLEIYQGKLIAYSLGNFLFDQYFSEDTLQGLLLTLTISPSETTASLQPIVTVGGQVRLLTGSKRDALLARLSRDSTVPDGLREDIKNGQFSF